MSDSISVIAVRSGRSSVTVERRRLERPARVRGARPGEQRVPAQNAQRGRSGARPGFPVGRWNDEILDGLVQLFPKAFFPRGRTPVPLAHGVDHDILTKYRTRLIQAAGLDPDIPYALLRDQIRVSLRLYTMQKWYLTAILDNQHRVDLAGRPVTPIAEGDREAARRRLGSQNRPPLTAQAT